MKTEDVCHHLFSMYSSGLLVWRLVSLPTNTVCPVSQPVRHWLVHIITSVTNSTEGNKNALIDQYSMESGSTFTAWCVSSIVYVVLLLFPNLSLGGKGEDMLSQAHVGLPDKNFQEYLTPKAEAWPHVLSSPFPSLLTGGSPSLVKTKSFSFLLQFLYLKLV